MSGRSEAKLVLLLVLMSGYLLFDYSFTQVRVPPLGLGVPLGELFLVGALLTTDIPLVLSRLGSVIYLLPFAVWWAFGLSRAIYDCVEYGRWAFRDATQVIESLFLVIGFSVAATPHSVERIMRWLPLILAATCLYGLGYPFQQEITAMSPGLSGAVREPVPIFGNYVDTSIAMLWLAFYCLVHDQTPRFRHLRSAIAGLLIAFTILVIQSRTTYMQLLGIGALLLMVKPRAIGRLSAAIPALFIALAVITMFDLHIAGRLTDKISLSFLADHIQTIFGDGGGDSSKLNAAAQGINLRLTWWQDIYARLTSDPATLLTGLGYGIPLTSFRDEFGDIVREPHNSFISVIARLGVLGFAAWAWMQIELFRAAFRAHAECKRLGWTAAQMLLLMTIALGALVLIGAFGEDELEKPYYAIPLYTLWGVSLRLAFAARLQRQAVFARGSSAMPPQPAIYS